MQRIYLDNNATTPLDPRIFKAMLADLSGPPANPSSVHWFGQCAKQLLGSARNTVATYFQAKPEEITFTSGGTESNNLLLHSLGPKGHCISTPIEHSSIYRTLKTLETKGLSVTYLPVTLWGAPLPEQVESAIRPDTRAIILSAANTETGVKLDIETIASIAQKRQVPFLLDAVAYIGKEALPLHPGITAVTLSGHKFHAPKGVGALFCRSTFKLIPLHTGGNQEYQHRAGTENLSGILGLAAGIQILLSEQTQITQQLSDLRHHLEYGLKQAIPDLAINGEGPRVANTVNIALPGLDGETLLIQLDAVGIAVSHGSACTSGALEPSRVLTNMGLDQKTARSSLRFSIGRTNTREEIDRAVELTTQIVKRLRKAM